MFRLQTLLLLRALIGGSTLITSGQMIAQTFTTLHNFTGSEGANPAASLILSGGTLYGTTQNGGSFSNGTVFGIKTDGGGYTILHNFTAASSNLYINSDGAAPRGGLVLSGNTLYGTTGSGGRLGYGTVFKVNIDGTGFTSLHSLDSEGRNPNGDLILSSNTLYGTAFRGGSSGRGSVFAVNTNGTGFTNLHSFIATNSGGVDPQSGVFLSDNILYGTTYQGGSSGDGTIFALSADGTFFTILHDFTWSDGNSMVGGLILWGGTLYGTSGSGGRLAGSDPEGVGTVFAVNTDGTDFKVLFRFIAAPASYINSDGASSVAGLVLSGNRLYGTAFRGGTSGNGTLFAVSSDGSGFTNLHNFTAFSGILSTNSDGAKPTAGLILSSNILYGTAYFGGSVGNGTIFSLTLPPPQLTIVRSGPDVILTWPTNAAGFKLQSATNFVSPAVWATVSPGPIVVNGENAVTNVISGTTKFFRLSQ